VLIQQKDKLTEKFSSLSKKIQAKLPLERKEGEFLTEIDKVAEETNVHIETMNPRPLRDLGFFKELSVEIDMEANLGNLVRFLYQMRKSSVVLVANRLRLKPKSERSALLKGHLVISTIFLKEQ
jgi:Tfp pilus assembly protein PilO